MQSLYLRSIVTLAAFAGLAVAQDGAPPPQDGGWRRLGDAPQAIQNAPPPVQTPPPQAYNNAPSVLTIRPGTFVIVRVNQFLSSDRNHPGDLFTATLEQPLIVDGIVVAQRGATIAGHVAEAQKAHRGDNVSRLGIELTDLTLVDGNQVPIQTELISQSGPGWNGQDTGTVAGANAQGALEGAGGAGGG